MSELSQKKRKRKRVGQGREGIGGTDPLVQCQALAVDQGELLCRYSANICLSFSG